ncbi:MAG: glycosyltransferase family A protein [Undibacterium sp.]|nr:glycosyltransferase family A protein [Undibacterium sp.]
MKSLSGISVIIPTIAIKEREVLLRRAIDSIRHSSANQIQIIVVVNGGRADPEICNWLKLQPDIHYEYVATPSLPQAIFRGRELVQTPFFSFLDDDDEYLTSGTDTKFSIFSSQPDIDIVVTSGFRHIAGVDEPIMVSIEDVPSAPLSKLFDFNWLSSCNALYRSSSFPAIFFADFHAYAEWTWFAFKLALSGKQIRAVNRPTFRINDTPDSLSKSQSYYDSHMLLYRRMLNLAPPRNIVRVIKQRISADWHDQSVRSLSDGRKLNAITCHLRSLIMPGGFQYLMYTRRLFPFWRNS